LYERLVSDGAEVLGIGKDSTRSTGRSHSTIDISRRDNIASIVRDWHPDAIFYLAAVHQSSQEAASTSDDILFENSTAVNVQGVVNFLEVLPGDCSLFYAASSHVFGKPESAIQDETTPFCPNSIYGITKTAGIHACRYYRHAHAARASVGILYNHESPLRRPEFVSKRIAQSAVAISRGQRDKLTLGDLEAEVDWGYAPDYVDAMVRIVGLPDADDFIVATGETHSVREFAEIAFSCVSLDWKDHVRIDDRVLRRKSWSLSGNSARLRERTGWAPTISFNEMVRRLVDAEKMRARD
jgi:GDPmannose 4,6-dehydratase